MEKHGVIKLEGASKWSVWRFQISIILRDLGLYNIVTGTEAKSSDGGTDAKAAIVAAEKDIKAMSVIVTRLSEAVLQHVITCETSRAVWERLHSVYERRGETSIMMCQQKFFQLRFEDNMCVADFITKVQEQQQILQRLGEGISNRMVISKIIMSLPEKFSYFVSAWESCAEDRQTLDNLTARLLVEEERLKSKNSKAENIALFSKEGYKNKSNMKCFLCQKPGHMKKDCRMKNVCFDCKNPGPLQEPV